MKPIQFAAAGLVVALAGCGGGSGGDGGDSSEAIAEAGRRLGGLSAPGFTAEEFAAGMEMAANDANTLVLSGLVFLHENERLPPDLRLSTRCAEDRCVYIEPILGTESEVTLDDVRADAATVSTLSAIPIGERQGVRVAHARGTDRLNIGVAISPEGYGAWMEHGAFLVTVAPVEDGDFEGARIVSSMSVGDSPNEAPDIAAVWNGIVAAVDIGESETSENLVQGQARIELELQSGEAVVDVAFTELFDLETEESRGSLHWEDVAFTEDGFKDGRSIDGRFYGPNHEATGGVFERGDLLGAFGATKEEQSE